MATSLVTQAAALAVSTPKALEKKADGGASLIYKRKPYKNQVQDHDPKLWNRARQIAWIQANYRKKVWVKWINGDMGWLTQTPAVELIRSGQARLFRLG